MRKKRIILSLLLIVFVCFSVAIPNSIVKATTYDHYYTTHIIAPSSLYIAMVDSGPLTSQPIGAAEWGTWIIYDFYGVQFDFNQSSSNPSGAKAYCYLGSDTYASYYDNDSVESTKGIITAHTSVCVFYASELYSRVDFWVPQTATSTSTTTTTPATATPTATATPGPDNLPPGWWIQDARPETFAVNNTNYGSYTISTDDVLCSGGIIGALRTTYTWSLSWHQDESSGFYANETIGGNAITIDGPRYNYSQPFRAVYVQGNAGERDEITVDGSTFHPSTYFDGYDVMNGTSTVPSVIPSSGLSSDTMTDLTLGTFGVTGSVTLNIQAACYKTPDFSQFLFGDGDMEQWQNSTYWIPEFVGVSPLLGLDAKSDTYWQFLRFNPAQEPWYQAWHDMLVYGTAACHDGFQAVGNDANLLGNLAVPIGQDFIWPGGTLYWKVKARGSYSFLFPFGGVQSAATVDLYNPDGSITPLLYDELLTGDWQTFKGSLSLGPGTYKLMLDNNQILERSSSDSRIVYYDDVWIDKSELPDECGIGTSNLPDGTITPTGTVTLVTNTPNWYNITPTAEWSTPQPLVIWNCGFESGSNNWYLNSTSHIELAGGPTGPQNLMATGAKPNAYQMFSVPSSENLYFTVWVRGPAEMKLVNIDNGAENLLYEGTTNDWAQIKRAQFVTSGRYRLELNSMIYGQRAWFDGITLAQGSFSQWQCSNTPTPGPTSFVTATITPDWTSTPSQTPNIPTITPWVWSSSTPMPTSNTPTPGAGTPTADIAQTQAAATATQAAGATATQGAGLTATASAIAQMTATAQGTPGGGGGSTSTPDGGGGGGTPTPNGGGGSIGQPPPGDGAPCTKPSTIIDIGNWLGYYYCTGLSWISWGPSNTQQLQDIGNGFENYEPFGTISEINNAIADLKSQVDAQGVSSGLPGQNALPNSNIFNQGGANPFSGARITLNPSGTYMYSTSCSSRIQEVVGTGPLFQSMCFMFDILRQNNLMPWIQAFINLSCIIAMGIYVSRKFVDLFLT